MRKLDPSLFSPYEKAFLSGEKLSRYAFSLCGGPCAGLLPIENGEMLRALTERCISLDLPYRVFGGMTNVLVSDEGFDGVILLNRRGGISHAEDESGNVELHADSGTGIASVVRYCIENGISGFEWAAGLPGPVGGAVYGNAGAFGSDISRSFQYGNAVDRTGSVFQITNAGMDFAYRSSVLKREPESPVLLDAVFRLSRGTKEAITAECEEHRAARKASQPVDAHSLGSVFKNPLNESAGRLIQAAGLKGFSIGKATVSMKHANFITTEAGVTAADYRQLVLHVQKTVFESFGVLLEPEIELLGFGPK